MHAGPFPDELRGKAVDVVEHVVPLEGAGQLAESQEFGQGFKKEPRAKEGEGGILGVALPIRLNASAGRPS